MLAALSVLAQQPTQPQPDTAPRGTVQQTSSTQASQPAKKGCLVVRSVGSHAARNIMLFGVAGALISKQQYAVVDSEDYPARVGEKFHGNDLETISSTTKVVVLDKHYTPDDLHKACE
jgi:hypothetical protein